MPPTDPSLQDMISNITVAQMYVEDWAHGADLSAEDLTKRVKHHIKDDAKFHGEGIAYKHDAAGVEGFVQSAKHAHQIYKFNEFRPLAFAASNDQAVVFVLIHFRVQNIGEYHGHPPTNRETQGIQVEELWFDLDNKITDIWVRRQLAQEEREALLQAPEQQPAPQFKEEDLGSISPGSTPEHTTKEMSQAMKTWIEAWNAKSKGQLDPSVLDAILAPNFTVHDACGIHGKHGHMFEISSAEDAKLAMQQFTEKWDVKESLVTIAASTAHTVGFTHWKATLTSRDKGHEESLDAIDVVLFKEGKLASIWQFRTPVTYEKKYVLATEQ